MTVVAEKQPSRGRPAGEVRMALLAAARELTTADRSPTMREMAAHSLVGFMAARRTVDHMRRAGRLKVVRTRRVDYRNRPVAEYALPEDLQRLGIEPAPIRTLYPDWRTPIV